MNPFIEGFLLQASLILALGAQNLFVLESGLKKRRHLVVAFVCSICDAALIALGVGGAASLFLKMPILKIGFGFLGVGFLVYYGTKKLVEGLRVNHEMDSATQTGSSLKDAILLALAFSLLNPHVYLDTIVLIGGYSTQFSDLSRRARFGAGAASFSILWFFGLSVFAFYLSVFLKSKRFMKIIALLSGLVLLGLAWKLGRDVYSWIPQ